MKVKYFVNKEKRTITAVLELEDTERYDVMYYASETNTDALLLPNFYNLRLRRTYSGVATCLPEDTWDEEYGKTIARRKAYGKYLMARAKKVGQITAAIDKVWHQVNSKEIDLWNKAADYSDKTDELSGFNEE